MQPSHPPNFSHGPPPMYSGHPSPMMQQQQHGVAGSLSPMSGQPREIVAPGPLEVLEYMLRVAFFAFVPFGVVLLAMLVPMGAAIVQMVLALLAFFFGEMLTGAAEKRPWLKRVLRKQLAFEAYYRQHAPRPFIYYVFYPLLFPYWLFISAEARREFLLFKGYTILAIVLFLVGSVYRWFAIYQPELGPKEFALAFLIQLVIESLAVMMMIMPMTTTVVALHRKRQHWRLVALLAIGLLSAGLAAAFLSVRHRSFPSLETRQRIVARNTSNRVQSKLAMQHALNRAWSVRRATSKDEWERETDGTITGKPLEEARDVLEEYYRDDEAGAFELWTTSRKEKPAMMVIFAEGRKKGSPVWLGMRSDGSIVDKINDVPKTARKAMRSAGEL